MSPGTKKRLALPTPQGAYECYALAANSVVQQRTGPFRGCHAVFSAACVPFMFGETSVALVTGSIAISAKRRYLSYRLG